MRWLTRDSTPHMNTKPIYGHRYQCCQRCHYHELLVMSSTASAAQIGYCTQTLLVDLLRFPLLLFFCTSLLCSVVSLRSYTLLHVETSPAIQATDTSTTRWLGQGGLPGSSGHRPQVARTRKDSLPVAQTSDLWHLSCRTSKCTA